MKKKLFVTLGAALCLGAGTLLISHAADVSVLNVKDVESLAGCEVYDSAGNLLGGCSGDSPAYWFDNIYCEGKELRN